MKTNNNETNAKFTTVSIPKPLANKMKKLIEKTGFTSLSSFVEYILREIASENGKNTDKTKNEAENVEDKLRRLGYL